MGIISSTYIFEVFFACIAVFSGSIDFWTPHNIIADSQSLGLDSWWIPNKFLLIFIRVPLFLVCCCIWSMSCLEIQGVSLICISSMWTWKRCVLSKCGIDVSIRSNLLTVLFKVSLYLLNSVFYIYQFQKKLYKYPHMVVYFSVSLCGSSSFCFTYFDAML